jgi:GxxExxY protein
VLLDEELSERVIGLAIDVPREIGPGLRESVYERCPGYELGKAGIGFERQVAIGILQRRTAG